MRRFPARTVPGALAVTVAVVAGALLRCCLRGLAAAAESMARAAAAVRAGSRPTITTCAPRAHSCVARQLPSPDVAPVTIATLLRSAGPYSVSGLHGSSAWRTLYLHKTFAQEKERAGVDASTRRRSAAIREPSFAIRSNTKEGNVLAAGSCSKPQVGHYRFQSTIGEGGGASSPSRGASLKCFTQSLKTRALLWRPAASPWTRKTSVSANRLTTTA